VLKERHLGAQRLVAVLDEAPELVFIQIIAHSEGEVDRVRAKTDLTERFASKCPEFFAALVGDGVNGPGRKVSLLFGSERLDQALARHAVQRAVQRAWADL
jgi:hypothetical protein